VVADLKSHPFALVNSRSNGSNTLPDFTRIRLGRFNAMGWSKICRSKEGHFKP
jgi:hypothetical protein